MPPELPSSRPPPVTLRPIRVDRTRPDGVADTEFGRLPTPLTSLVGRDADVAMARALLVDAGVRLLTLTGPGGVGKTRLALAVAAEVAADFPDGDAFVSLAAISDPALVLSAIARALGIRETLERPVAPR